jgi:hypothetical protein
MPYIEVVVQYSDMDLVSRYLSYNVVFFAIFLAVAECSISRQYDHKHMLGH